MTDTLNEDQYKFFIISFPILLRMRNISDTICRENQNIHFMFYDLFIESRASHEIIRTFCTAGQATRDNVGQEHCRLDTYSHKHLLGIRIAYCFSTATLHERTSVLY